MLNSHASLGIAQIVFYIPILPLALYLLIRNWPYRPRMAWWPMVPLSLMRIAGGGCIIALEVEDSDNVGLITAAIVLLNVGAIPLIVNELGFVRAVLMDNFSHLPALPRLMKSLRLSMILPVALLVTGGSLIGVTFSLARKLEVTGYAVFAVILCVLVGIELYLWTMRTRLIPSSRRILLGGMIAAPFLIVRNVFGILEVATSGNLEAKWNPVYGSAVAFACMALLMEYIPICTWLWVGYSIAPDRGVDHSAVGDLESK